MPLIEPFITVMKTMSIVVHSHPETGRHAGTARSNDADITKKVIINEREKNACIRNDVIDARRVATCGAATISLVAISREARSSSSPICRQLFYRTLHSTQNYFSQCMYKPCIVGAARDGILYD